jgi:hypothetical protein
MHFPLYFLCLCSKSQLQPEVATLDIQNFKIFKAFQFFIVEHHQGKLAFFFPVLTNFHSKHCMCFCADISFMSLLCLTNNLFSAKDLRQEKKGSEEEVKHCLSPFGIP